MAYSYEKVYSQIKWKNKSEGLTTPLGKTNLNRGDVAIDTIDDRVIVMSKDLDDLHITKADTDTVNKLFKDVTYNTSTGIFTFTYYDGSTKALNTNLSKIAVNFEYDPTTEQLIITQSDGTKVYVDLTSLITVFSFHDTDTIEMVVGADGSVSANVKLGSIKKENLASEVLAELVRVETACKTSETNAKTSEDNAEASNISAESYAHGQTNSRDNEDVDNAKYYMEQAKDAAETSKNYAKVNNPNFLLANNRIYVKRQSSIDFQVYNNRLYFKVG